MRQHDRERDAADDAGQRAGGTGGEPPPGEFQHAAERLERAVQALIRAAGNQVSDRAADFLEDTARRLEREAEGRGAGRRERRRSRRHGYRASRRVRYGASAGDPEQSPDGDGYRHGGRLPRRRLRLDSGNAWVCGLCAGIARYHGMEPWVVRCIVFTAALFFPSIVIPAYFIMYLVIRKRARHSGQSASGHPDSDRAHAPDAPAAPEFGARLSPRRSLKDLQGTLSEVELRLRRMESHVTSDRYELQRELNRIA